jgi:hypothetical protein
VKPKFSDGVLSVELHKPEVAILERARAIGQALEAMHQESGAPLVAACDAILKPAEVE